MQALEPPGPRPRARRDGRRGRDRGARARPAHARVRVQHAAPDKATKDRLRHYEHWLASRNLSNEASDESVEALIAAVQDRYELARRWYRLKAKILGLDRLAHYDRMAPLGEADRIPYGEAQELVLDCYRGFSPELGEAGGGFFADGYIDGPPGRASAAAPSAPTPCPAPHPYVLLNYTSRPGDVLTMAHELGHGVHAVARPAAGHVRLHQPAHRGRDRVDLRRDDRARAAARARRPTPPRGCRCWPSRWTARWRRSSARSR